MNKNLIIALNAIEGKHDLELALIDDLKSIVSKGKIVNDEMVDGQIQVKQVALKTIDLAKKHLINLQNVSNLIGQIKSQADAIGLDATKIKEYKDGFDFLNGNPKGATEVIIKNLQNVK
jgi:hypothetical protein